MTNKPKNHLVLAIICTIFCCLPLGIVSIINGAKVDGLYKAGDYQGAVDASENAKKYAVWGMILGFIVIVAYLLIGIAESY